MEDTKERQDVHRAFFSSYPFWYVQNDLESGILPDISFYDCGIDLHSRIKFQTKDNTGALKLWLLQHKRNPYPGKPEKIMLAILSGMTLTQVSTWFANARRRLKKECPGDSFIGFVDTMDTNDDK